MPLEHDDDDDVGDDGDDFYCETGSILPFIFMYVCMIVFFHMFGANCPIEFVHSKR